jgi:hypothetical protein
MRRDVWRVDGREASAVRGNVVWAPAKSLWNSSMYIGAMALANVGTTIIMPFRSPRDWESIAGSSIPGGSSYDSCRSGAWPATWAFPDASISETICSSEECDAGRTLVLRMSSR